MAARLERLEQAIAEAVRTAAAPLRTVIAALEALRGIALVSAVTVASEVGEFSRFRKATGLKGYSGIVASEHSTGGRAAGAAGSPRPATPICAASWLRQRGPTGTDRVWAGRSSGARRASVPQ